MLYDKLSEYCSKDYYPFHMPGHKRNFLNGGISNADLPYGIDITEIEGFDNLHDPKEILKECMEYAGQVYGSDKTYFLVNGSSCGILSAICGITDMRDEIIVARNSHKAVYHGIYLKELKPAYIYPEVIHDLGINGEIYLETVKRAILEHPHAKAVIITSPTYEGIVSDIANISKLVHEYNMILIVDEAHGAHFRYHDKFPRSALELGADIVVQSLHKTMPSLTQTALLHVRSKLVDIKNVEKYLKIFQTTSPSYILMASIDRCIRYMENNKDKIFPVYIDLLESFYTKSNQLKHINIDSYDNKDIAKLVISVKSYNDGLEDSSKKITGTMMQKILLQQDRLEIEMAGVDYVLAMTSCMDTKEGFERLYLALEKIDRMLELNLVNENIIDNNSGIDEVNRKIDLLYGKTADDYIYIYPPGIPILVPGEICSREILHKLKEYADTGIQIYGL